MNISSVNISSLCNNYCETVYCKDLNPNTDFISSLGIWTLLGFALPVCSSLIFTGVTLCERVFKKEEFLSPQDELVQRQGKQKLPFKKATSALTAPQNLSKTRQATLVKQAKERQAKLVKETKEAVQGEHIHTGPNGISYDKLRHMIDNASFAEIPLIIKEAVAYQYEGGLSIALAQLLINYDSLKSKNNLSKLNLALGSLDEAKLLKTISYHQDRISYAGLQHHFSSLHRDVDEQKLDLLLKYKGELSLSRKVVKKAEEVLKQKNTLYEATKNLPEAIID